MAKGGGYSLPLKGKGYIVPLKGTNKDERQLSPDGDSYCTKAA